MLARRRRARHRAPARSGRRDREADAPRHQVAQPNSGRPGSSVISAPEQRAAIDLENLASHEGSLGRGQVAHEPGDICRATSAAHQCLRHEAETAG